jgi:hypothetical protein
MTSQPQQIGSGKNLAARPLEVEFAVVLSRVIESIEDDPAPLLRNAVYELARIKLRREAWQRNPAMNLSEVRRLTLGRGGTDPMLYFGLPAADVTLSLRFRAERARHQSRT